MSLPYLITVILLTGPAIITLIELINRLEIFNIAKELKNSLVKTLNIINAKGLSDDYKQKEILKNSKNNFILIFKFTLNFILIILTFGLIYFFTSLIYFKNIEIIKNFILKIDTQLTMFFFAVFYITAKKYLKKL